MDQTISPAGLRRVVCRPARPADKPQVLEMVRTIWDGHDYIPSVWDEWLADPLGVLTVAEFGKCVVGIGKLTQLAPGQWWMEGLRVHPDYRGQGVASRLHIYLVSTWERLGGGAVRLETSSDRYPVHHLCAQTGFHLAVEICPYWTEAVPGDTMVFERAVPGDAPKVVAHLASSPLVAWTAGLVDIGWRWLEPVEGMADQAIAAGETWWWQGGEGVLTVTQETDGDQRLAILETAACAVDRLGALLSDFCRLAAVLGCTRACWNPPNLAEPIQIAESAGYRRMEDNNYDIFEKKSWPGTFA